MIEELGHNLKRVTLRNGGLTARFLNIGATLQDLYLKGWAPSLVLGFDNPFAYLSNPPYFGAIVGRYANRIANGRAKIDGVARQFDHNTDAGHILHGGENGSANRIWQIGEHSKNYVVFQDVMSDEHMGFPGELRVAVRFTLLENATLDIQITAISNAITLCNFAHHSYFTLNNAGQLGGHELQIDANTYLPVDSDGIPLGSPAQVAHTPLDFRQFRPLDLTGKHTDLDHNFCLSPQRRDLQQVARLKSRETGLGMTLETTEPGLQVYTAAALDGTGATGLHGRPYTQGAGLALEPQIWPDAPNHTDYPSAILIPGARYFQHSRFNFTQNSP